MNNQTTLMSACLAGFLGVALGAFGAHGLKGMIEPSLMAAYQTGVQYHLVHAVALLAVGVWQQQQGGVNRWLNRAAMLLLAGLILFSGSLYLMAITGIRPLGIITPIGGTCWLIGWAMLAWSIRTQPDSTPTNTSNTQ
ncbi:MAG: DUF423 domain-containing protein [Oceanobacter sp.]